MRTFFIACMLMTAAALSAQTEKGRFIISGQTSIDLSYTVDYTKNANSSSGQITQENYNINIAPAIGYFVADNFAISLQGDYLLQDGDYMEKMSQFTLMPSAMYYVPTAGKLRPLLSVGAGYANISQYIPITPTATSKHSFSGFTWGVAAGAAYFINRYISLDLSLQYSDINTSYSGDSSMKIKMNGIGGAIGFTLYL